jgi:hypothetical protein
VLAHRASEGAATVSAPHDSVAAQISQSPRVERSPSFAQRGAPDERQLSALRGPLHIVATSRAVVHLARFDYYTESIELHLPLELEGKLAAAASRQGVSVEVLAREA